MSCHKCHKLTFYDNYTWHKMPCSFGQVLTYVQLVSSEVLFILVNFPIVNNRTFTFHLHTISDFFRLLETLDHSVTAGDDPSLSPGSSDQLWSSGTKWQNVYCTDFILLQIYHSTKSFNFLLKFHISGSICGSTRQARYTWKENFSSAFRARG